MKIRPMLAALAAAAVLVLAGGSPASAERRGLRFANPVLAGDHPDPSIVRVGKDFWATATSSEWGPEFPILHSRDLVNWELRGYVFPERPAWAVGNFWAPEIGYRGGRFFVYYVARKAGASLCVGVATAPRADGPWTDHGPLVCQDAGSIDPMMIEDEHGRPYLLWKEDGNSRREPTPIWAQPLSEDGSKLIGTPKELFRNDAPWEKQLVEGPFVVRKGRFFYVFYAGNACCGRECDYAVGVARSTSLLGPYEKNPANPILAGNATWKCPGHGSVVNAGGRDYFLYHAYAATNGVYVGRQALLDEVAWGADGWPTINGGKGPSRELRSPFGARDRRDDMAFSRTFSGARLGEGLTWPQGARPALRFERGALSLAPGAGATEAVLARFTTAPDYTAMAVVVATGGKGLAGLSAFGDLENNLGVGVRDGEIVVWRREKNETKTLATVDAPRAPAIRLRMTATGGDRFRFAVWDRGRWVEIGSGVEGGYLPPWDRGVRVALVASGGTDAVGRFSSFAISPRFAAGRPGA